MESFIFISDSVGSGGVGSGARGDNSCNDIGISSSVELLRKCVYACV